MGRFILRRLLQAVPLLLAVVVLNFLLIAFTPGDPITLLVGDFPAPPEYLAQMRRDYGLDQPVWMQLLRYLGKVLQGDFGFSFANQQPVASLILERLGATLELTLTALGLASVLGVAFGVLAARSRGGAADSVIQAASSAGYAVPDFWLGQLLILAFAIGLGWLPSQGYNPVRGVAPGWEGFVQHLRYLLLPALALSMRYLTLITRITRASMLEVMNADYILAARARGSAEWQVVLGHALRNAAAPVLTVIGYNLGFVLAGSALIEAVFAWPGIGRLLYESIAKRDYPVMLAILLMVSVTVVLANLLTDILHRLLDPRLERA
ncbi:ABC transporter permease [Pseudacidovorax intermedius]|uniref:Peptide/nickel transport system permease protein n=1 Tax=Pseudacidovorax intermedius TaxID=433924 RepID=A0A370F2W2_9BURK|nr:ABC transporter permease [Pseudacidovorax intermedius]RDI17016.1 peptide/nickel transport system permease protein [Pseudacidovorax intermedius]